MNKGSKMKAGWQIILANEKMICAHMRSGNNINKLRATLHNIFFLSLVLLTLFNIKIKNSSYYKDNS